MSRSECKSWQPTVGAGHSLSALEAKEEKEGADKRNNTKRERIHETLKPEKNLLYLLVLHVG